MNTAFTLLIVLVLVANLGNSDGKVSKKTTPNNLPFKAPKLASKKTNLPTKACSDCTLLGSDLLAAGSSNTVAGSSSNSAAMINLSKTILGAGALSLSYGIASFTDKKEGIVPGVALLFVMGAISAYSFYSIGRVCDYYNASSFSAAWERTVGPSSKKFLEFILIFKTFFTCLAYSIIIGK